MEPRRLILGNGAAELLSAATRALIEPGQKLLTPWPSYPLYPLMARRAHGLAVRVSGGVDEVLEAAAHEPGVRVVALASPNDPTGELLATAELERLLDGLPEGVAVLLDESLVEFADAQPTDSSLGLLESHPRLLVFRSFSKAWGLAGLRIGYAVGGPGSEELLAELEPDLGVSEVSQAGALEALRSCSELIERRVQVICAERPRLTTALRERGFEVSDSQANFLWIAHPTLDGGELAARLARTGILVAAGDALGEPRHVRIGLRYPRRHRPPARRHRQSPLSDLGLRVDLHIDGKGVACDPPRTQCGLVGACADELRPSPSPPDAGAPRWCPRGSSAKR